MFAASGVIPVRDSKAPNGPSLAFPAASWQSFTTTVKAGTSPAV
ncbi:DUF397 domain-containing protein [Streptomyces sp. NPDC052396]